MVNNWFKMINRLMLGLQQVRGVLNLHSVGEGIGGIMGVYTVYGKTDTNPGLGWSQWG